MTASDSSIRLLEEKANPGRDGVTRACEQRRLAADPDLARHRRQQASQSAPDHLVSLPAQAGEAENLAGAGVERHRPAIPNAQPVDFEHRPRTCGTDGGDPGGRHPAHDVAHELLGRKLRDRGIAGHVAAVAQHGHGIGQPEYLVEPVGDIDDTDATRAQRPHGMEQVGNVGLGQARGRFVEHQDIEFPRQGARDRYDRLLGLAQLPDRGVQRQRDSERPQRLSRSHFDRAPIDQGAAARVAEKERHVLADAHRVDQAEILMDEGDRARGEGLRDRAAAQRDLTAVGRVDTSEYLDQRRLAGPVGAQQRMHLPCGHGQVHVGQRRGAAETLGKPAHHQALEPGCSVVAVSVHR